MPVAKAQLSRADLIANAKTIIGQYGGMKLTVRQIYYRLVAKQLIPNSVKSYNRVKEALIQARRDHTIPYSHIEDRTREVHQYHTAYRISKTTYAVRNEASEESAESFLNGYLDTVEKLDQRYNLPRWWNQPKKVMVFVEKEALAGLFQEVTDQAAVDLVVCRGYASLSLLYDIAVRLERLPDYVEEVYMLYFGDFDPSGADIERAIKDTLEKDFDVDFNIERIAITREQIDDFQIPPAPAKMTDSRYDGFVAEHGVDWQVELDAIEPTQLQDIITEAIDAYFDQDIYDNDRCPELERRQKKLKGWVARCLDKTFQRPKKGGKK